MELEKLEEVAKGVWNKGMANERSHQKARQKIEVKGIQPLVAHQDNGILLLF